MGILPRRVHARPQTRSRARCCPKIGERGRLTGSGRVPARSSAARAHRTRPGAGPAEAVFQNRLFILAAGASGAQAVLPAQLQRERRGGRRSPRPLLSPPARQARFARAGGAPARWPPALVARAEALVRAAWASPGDPMHRPSVRRPSASCPNAPSSTE